MCGAAVGCSNIAYPKLVVELMPSGRWTGGGAAVSTGLCRTPRLPVQSIAAQMLGGNPMACLGGFLCRASPGDPGSEARGCR